MNPNTQRHPQFLALTQHGNLVGYFREDILKGDLAIHRRDGEPAEEVFELQSTLTITYQPAERFAEYLRRYQKYRPLEELPSVDELLADGLAHPLTDTERERLKTKAMQQIKHNFNPEVTAEGDGGECCQDCGQKESIHA